MPKQRKTNQQTLKDIMNYSNFGPLAEMFVMDALYKIAEATATATPEEIAKMSNGLISGAAWVGVAQEIKGKLDNHFAS